MLRLVDWKNDVRNSVALMPLMMRNASQKVREYLIANMMNILFIVHLTITGSIGGFVGLKLIEFFWYHGLVIVWYSFLVVLAFYSLSSHLMMMRSDAESQASNVTFESPLREE